MGEFIISKVRQRYYLLNKWYMLTLALEATGGAHTIGRIMAHSDFLRRISSTGSRLIDKEHEKASIDLRILSHNQQGRRLKKHIKSGNKPDTKRRLHELKTRWKHELIMLRKRAAKLQDEIDELRKFKYLEGSRLRLTVI